MARKTQTTSRASSIRELRTQSQRKPAKKSRARQEEPVRNMPPVFVRGGSSLAQPRKTNRKSRPKRRFDIALNSPGVEMRLPALPMVKLDWRVLSFVLVVGLVALLYYLWTSPTYQVQSINLVGAARLTATDIQQKLNIVNKPIFTIQPAELEEILGPAFPELLEYSVRVGLPATVEISVIERTPLIEWQQDDNVFWIDGMGYKFEPRGEADGLVAVQAYTSPPVPIVEEEDEISDSEQTDSESVDFSLIEKPTIPKAFMSPEMVAAILVMRPQAPEESLLVYDAEYGLGWSDPRGWEVFFGMDVSSDIEMKLNIYHHILKQLKQDGIKPALISVEHLHAPFYRLER